MHEEPGWTHSYACRAALVPPWGVLRTAPDAKGDGPKLEPVEPSGSIRRVSKAHLLWESVAPETVPLDPQTTHKNWISAHNFEGQTNF